MNACRSCHAPIEWATTHKGKKMPIEPVPYGNLAVSKSLLGDLVVTYVGNGKGTHASHFGTCPYASEHRKRDE